MVRELVYQEMAIFTGNGHRRLAQDICNYLEMPIGACDVFEFSNENIFVRILENVRQRDVFIVQPLVSPVNTCVMELLIMIDAFKRASAGRITAVVPYFAYGRSDKKDQPRVPITGRLIANLIETAGADRLLTVDLHAGQIQGFFNIPVDELTAQYDIVRYFREKELKDLVLVATDAGAAKRARNVARELGAPMAVIDKRRIGNEEQVEAIGLIGDVKGCPTLIVEDEINTGGTIVESVRTLRSEGASAVYVACTHGILSGNAIPRLSEVGIEELVVTDSVPITPEKELPNLTVLTLAPLLGEAIRRIHTGQSVGELFQ